LMITVADLTKQLKTKQLRIISLENDKDDLMQINQRIAQHFNVNIQENKNPIAWELSILKDTTPNLNLSII
ncbi:14019_t:CDS:1, partial [Funneliformis caledonium]